MKTLKVGILGLAHLHPRGYMPLLAQIEGMEVVAVAERNRAVREPFIRDFPLRWYADWRRLIARESLDLALILLPHAQMPEAAEACAARGIHLLVEKPMAADSAGIRRISRAAAKHGVLLATPYLWRYHPVARKIKELLAEGVLGEPVAGEARCAAGRIHRYLDPEAGAGWMLRKRESGGGPMHNLGVHWIDLYRYLLGDEVVTAFGRNMHSPQVMQSKVDIEDHSFALLTFSRGTTVGLDISYCVPPGYPAGRDLFFSLRGTRGVLSWSPAFEGVDEELFVCSDLWAPETCRRLHFDLPKVKGYSGIGGLNFLQDLARAIREGGPPPISGEEGLRDLQVVEAIYRSAETDRVARVRA